MEVCQLNIWRRDSNSGKPHCGTCTFSDGKKWGWVRSLHDGSFYFVIDSGVLSQWGVGEYKRHIKPIKRITALKKKLQQENEL